MRFSKFARFQFCYWGIISVLYFLILYAAWKNPLQAFMMVLFMVPSLVVISLVFRSINNRFKIQMQWQLKTVVIVGGCVACGALWQLFYSDFSLAAASKLAKAPEAPINSVVKFVFQSLMLSGWYFAYLWGKSELAALVEAKNRDEAQATAERAELQMLRFQLNPHFLFNSLNGIITEIQDRPPVALEMTHRLAEYLRHTLEYRGEMIVPLSHEIDGARDYLGVEQSRFGDQLEISFDLPEDISSIRVPSFLFQPLLENGVKHGMGEGRSSWQLRLNVRVEGEGLVVQVFNYGKLSSQESTDKDGGVGLNVLKRRLALHYPGRSKFELRQEGAWVCAEISIKGAPC